MSVIRIAKNIMKLAIIDFNRTIYDPETNGLVPGALTMLQALSAVMPLVLVSKLLTFAH